MLAFLGEECFEVGESYEVLAYCGGDEEGGVCAFS